MAALPGISELLSAQAIGSNEKAKRVLVSYDNR
jgi:hypothetical protein